MPEPCPLAVPVCPHLSKLAETLIRTSVRQGLKRSMGRISEGLHTDISHGAHFFPVLI